MLDFLVNTQHLHQLHVLDDQVIKQVNDHTHVASRAVVESSKVRQEMKKRARESVADEFPLDAQEVIDYFEDTYIGRLRPGGHRRAPLFDLALWNMYDQMTGDLSRTNNAVEGWHRRFQANVGAYHPNFWNFIDILKREQSLNHVNISQARAGHQSEPQRRRYQDSNRPRLPQQGQIAVSPWPRPQHQYVKKRFFLKPPNYRLYATQNGSFKNHQPIMRLCQPCTTL